MPFSWLINGGYILTTYKSWDDPPSSNRSRPGKLRLRAIRYSGFIWGKRGPWVRSFGDFLEHLEG